jgi:ribosome assembly protein 1
VALTEKEIELKREAIRQKKLLEEASLDKTKLSDQLHKDGELVKIRDETLNSTSNDTSNDKNKLVFLAFARVFSGTLRKGQNLFLLSPKYNCEDFAEESFDQNASEEEIKKVSKHVCKFTIDNLYLMMGRELEPIDKVTAGNICAIGGLENILLKSATLSSTLHCPSFASMQLQTLPIVHVAIEPKNPCNK